MTSVATTLGAYSLAVFLGSAVLAAPNTWGESQPDHHVPVATGTFAGSGGWDFLWAGTPAPATSVADAVQHIEAEPTETALALEAEIQAYRELRDGWDGERAAAPLAASVNEAALFARRSSGLRETIEPSLHVDGSVILEWGDGIAGSLRFRGDRTIVYATARDGHGVEPFDGKVIPPRIVGLFKV